MTTNIYLAKLLAEEREHDLVEYAELRRRLRESTPPAQPRPSLLYRIFHPEWEDSTGATWKAA